MRLSYKNKRVATDEVIYNNFKELVEFRIGDVRDFHSVASALISVDIVFNAAALKQVPSCEYFPYEAVLTNITGPENIVRAIRENKLDVETVVGISTDKACKPVNVMGMTKALQERVFITANLTCPNARFICVRYGNVLASRGSVIPLFLSQIKAGGPVTLTTPEMTRFLSSLDDAVDVVFAVVRGANRGETYIPRVPSALMRDLASVMIGDLKLPVKITGIRPGEKVHEILISDEESQRTVERGKYFAIKPMLPEIVVNPKEKAVLMAEFGSADNLMNPDELKALLKRKDLMTPMDEGAMAELLR
jgi:UDP-glucose 4-epimerase